MASGGNNEDDADQVVPEDSRAMIRSIQSQYLLCPPPSSSTVISETESIFLEPIHLSSAVAAKKIIREELKPRTVKVRPTPDSMRESARQLMVEDLYNRVKEMMDDTSSYNTPCLLDIQRALVQDRMEAPLNPVDEVWPSIFIAEKTVAVNKSRLKRMGITHILNAAHGTGVYTSKGFYKDMKVQYHAVEVDDFSYVDISPHFRKAAEFLDEALLTHKGKVLVNSVMGISRSAVLVAAYLMIFHHMTIMEALMVLRKKRPICPNEGFLKQLRQLNEALLQEREGDEHDDCLGQDSVIQACTNQEEEQNILGAEAQSSLMEEKDDEDGKSEMSSVAPIPHRHALTEHNQQKEDQASTLSNEQEMDNNNKDLICEWQHMNERYQSEDRWQAQRRREDEEPSLAGSCHLPEYLESVYSADVRHLNEQVCTRRMRRHRQADSVSAVGSSYADTGKQWLRETKTEADNQYRNRHQGEGNMTRDKCGQEDEESLLPEDSPLYRSSMNSKDTLTSLERLHVRQIQFGWNKKDTITKKTSINNGQEDSEGEEFKVPALEDVDLTAYHNWKLKRQMKMGVENKDEILELRAGQGSASDKRKQHLEDVPGCSCQNLEESQSMSGWDKQSSPSGGSIPLSAVWSNVSSKSTGDNARSLLSMQSKCSSLSQTRSVSGQPLVPLLIPPCTEPQVPIETPAHLYNTHRPEVVNLQSIQNWNCNVVREDCFQKQDERTVMEGSMPPNQANYMFSLGTQSCERRTTLSEASYSCTQSPSRPASVLSAHTTSSCPDNGDYKGKTTEFLVPRYSIFQDKVDLHNLDTMDKEMKSEMRGKMTTYEMQKIGRDNKCSNLFKKKQKGESDEDDEDSSIGISKTASKSKQTFVSERLDTLSGLTGRPSCSVILRNQISRNNGTDIKTPPDCQHAEGTKPRNSNYSSLKKQTTECSFTREQEEHERRSRFYLRAAREQSSSNQFQVSGTNVESHLSPPSECLQHSKSSPAEDYLSNSLTESKSYRMRRLYTTNLKGQEAKEELQDYAVKRKFRHFSGYEDSNTVVKRGEQVKIEKEEDRPPCISQHRLRSTRKAEEDQGSDITTRKR